MRTVLFTGGYGFIGSNLIDYWLKRYPQDQIVNVDALTYAAAPDNLNEVIKANQAYAKRYVFQLCDIRDRRAVEYVIQHHRPDLIVNLAAESHVCRSIRGPEDFFTTNIMGTFNLLEECRKLSDEKKIHFHHVSTDEVFGQLKDGEAPFREDNALLPRSPYAASKAASDMAVMCYRDTYGLSVTISNCSNNFGPYQHEEKLIPRIIMSLVQGKPIPLYGDGRQIRDWLFVADHCWAIDLVIHQGFKGHRYCVGGNREMRNKELAIKIHSILCRITGRNHELNFVHTNDRPTDDYRYAVDTSKIERDTGWLIDADFDYALECTIQHYLDRLESRQAVVRGAVQQGSGAV